MSLITLTSCAADIIGAERVPYPADTTVYLRASVGDSGDSKFTADIDRDSTGVWTITMVEPLYGFAVYGGEVRFGDAAVNTAVATPLDAVCAAIDDGKASGEVLGGRKYSFIYGDDDTPTGVTVDGVTYSLANAMPSDKVVLY